MSEEATARDLSKQPPLAVEQAMMQLTERIEKLQQLNNWIESKTTQEHKEEIRAVFKYLTVRTATVPRERREKYADYLYHFPSAIESGNLTDQRTIIKFLFSIERSTRDELTRKENMQRGGKGTTDHQVRLQYFKELLKEATQYHQQLTQSDLESAEHIINAMRQFYKDVRVKPEGAFTGLLDDVHSDYSRSLHMCEVYLVTFLQEAPYSRTDQAVAQKAREALKHLAEKLVALIKLEEQKA
jgi:hypothetical protein